MKDKIIEIEVRTVFGKDLIYPVNETAKVLARLTGKKTLNTSDLESAVKLGLTVKEVRPNKLKFNE